MTLHFVMIWESREEPIQFRTEEHTISGDELVKRMTAAVKGYLRADSKDWKLIGFSHTIIPETLHYNL